MFKLIVFLCFCVSLGVAETTTKHFTLASSVEQLTSEARHTLDSLPAHCTLGVEQLIAAEKLRTLTSCNYTDIVKSFAYALIDAADFTSQEVDAVKDIVYDVQNCTAQEDTTLEEVECIINVFLGSDMAQALEVFREYVYKVEGSVGDIIEEIKECAKKGLNSYELFLQNVISIAKHC